MQVTLCYDVQGNQNKAVEAQQPPALWLLPKQQGAYWPSGKSLRLRLPLPSLQQRWTACSLLHNQQTRGGTWRIHGITHKQVQRRVGCIEEGAPTL